MEIKIIPVQTRRDLKTFIYLPARIHKDHKNWVPPIYTDEWEFYNPHRNVAFSYSDTIMLLAEKNGEVAGRIMGIINHAYNDSHNLNEGRFCFLETYNDFDVAGTLISAVQEWATAKGMNTLIGPMGFSDKDPQGFMIEGFNEPVVIASNCNFAYMPEFMERMEFSKKIDLVVYNIKVPETIPEIYRKINDRIFTNNPDIKVVSFKSKKEIRPYIEPILTLVNETFADIIGFSPLSEKEMKEFATRYLPILDPHFLKVIINGNNRVIAFVLGMPDISEGIRACKGHIYPLGFLKIFNARRKTKQLNLLLGAVRKEYRDKGLNAVLGINMIQEAIKRKMEFIDSHLELENNLKMRAENERLGGVVYKRFRIYEKQLRTES